MYKFLLFLLATISFVVLESNGFSKDNPLHCVPYSHVEYDEPCHDDQSLGNSKCLSPFTKEDQFCGYEDQKTLQVHASLVHQLSAFDMFNKLYKFQYDFNFAFDATHKLSNFSEEYVRFWTALNPQNSFSINCKKKNLVNPYQALEIATLATQGKVNFESFLDELARTCDYNIARRYALSPPPLRMESDQSISPEPKEVPAPKRHGHKIR